MHRESIQDVFHHFESMSAAICSVAFCSSTDNLGKPGTCVFVCRDQRHWAARISHNVPCKFVPSWSRRSSDNLCKPGTCAFFGRDQRHWAVRISHNVPGKFVLSCSRHTHKRCSLWSLGATSWCSSAYMSHKSGTGSHCKPYAVFHVCCPVQTQTAATISNILCIAARLRCMQCTCTPPLDSGGLVSISQCSFAHMWSTADAGTCDSDHKTFFGCLCQMKMDWSLHMLCMISSFQ